MWLPETTNSVPVPPGWLITPAEVLPSPQSIVAVKSLKGAVGLPSVKVVTVWLPLSVPSVAVTVKPPVAVKGASAIVATCTAAPLLTPLLVATAVRSPGLGCVVNVIVKFVAVAAVTVPTAPRLKATELFAGVLEKPKPLIVIVVCVSS